ncbi:RNA pyrophosphohydrolase [Stappia sp.]|uniref:RNA pyrophosphohydrolase n=1 Tax=Stappia sp. TaxID=1870903 RepID=UPI003D122034
MLSPTALPRYRPCVGIVLLNRDGLVWTGKRAAEGGADPDHCWQMPQGGIDAGEDPLPAARRELYEETSIRSVTLLAEAPQWFSYDYPPELVSTKQTARYKGQTQKWYAFRFEGEEAEIDILTPPGGHKAEFCDWRWRPAAELPDLVIPFKRDVYTQVLRAFSTLTR